MGYRPRQLELAKGAINPRRKNRVSEYYMIYNTTFDYYPFRIDSALLSAVIDNVKDRLQHTPKADWSLSLIRSHVIQDLPTNHYTVIRQAWCDAVTTELMEQGFLVPTPSILTTALDRIIETSLEADPT